MKFYYAKLLLFPCVLAALTACSSPSQKADVPAGKSKGDLEQGPDKEQGDEFYDKNEDPNKKSIRQAPSADLYRRFSENMKAKQYRSANDVAAEILARNPNDAKTLNGLTVMAIDQGKLDLARMLISKQLTKNPQNTNALNNLGVIELKSDNLRLALVNFKKATEFDQANRAAHANLGTIYLQYRNYQNAANELQLAVNNGDKSPETLTNLGFALRGAGKFSEAEDAYEKALGKDQNNPVTLLNYAVLLVENKKDNGKALKILNKLRFVAREPAILERANALARKAEAKEKR